MPWLCTSSKKTSKTKVAGITQSRDDAVIANGRPSFAVVLQNFEASVADEVGVQRGQVVETLYTDGNWVYVRDLDGKCGYAPDNFCQALDQPGVNQWTCKSPSLKIRPRPKSIHIDRDLQHSNSLASVDLNFVSQNSGSMPNSSCTTPSSQRSSRANHTAASKPDDMEQEPAAANAPSQTSQDQVSTPAKIENAVQQQASEAIAMPRTLAFRPASGRSHSEGGTPMEPTPNIQNHPLLNRAMSYQEATANAERYALITATTPLTQTLAAQPLPNEGERTDISPASQDTAQQCTLTSQDQCDLTSQDTSQQCNPALQATAQHQDAELCDDVFESKKNMSIYYCRQNYKPRFKGEISLHRNELVIVSEAGKGEWVWVITNTNTQGLAPRHILTRYQPGSYKPMQADAATQTELIVSGIKLDVSRTPTRTRVQHTEESPPWFKHNDSLERPIARRVRQAQHSRATPTQPEQRVSALQQHERLMGAIGFEPEYDSCAQLSGQRRVQQTPVLTATRDYNPPANAKNCLLLKKGDILYSQPHMHYPKGWMWVWHSTQRSFGYVPKNHVAYMYLLQKGNRQHQQHILEDAV